MKTLKTAFLFLLFAQTTLLAQLFVSSKQIRQDGNDQLIERELRIILTGDSVILARPNERAAYKLRSVRKTRKGIVVRFGDLPSSTKQGNKIILFYNKQQAFVLELGEAHYYCWLWILKIKKY